MHTPMRKSLLLLAIALTTALGAYAQKPRLIIQIVAGSMRASDLERYAANFDQGGFRRLMDGGTLYTNAQYDCLQTTTPVSLATLATGALPSTHGIIGHSWIDYTSNQSVQLTEGAKGPGAYHLVAPSLGESLLQADAKSQCITVAMEPTSAVLLAGRTKAVYWLDERCNWATSPYYAEMLPLWIRRSNREQTNTSYLHAQWNPLLEPVQYLNTRRWDITAGGGKQTKKQSKNTPTTYKSEAEQLRHTPAGNSAVLGFAKQLLVLYQLGEDNSTDLINIHLDACSHIVERYGPESMEAEDMYYRLDRDLADFLTFVFALLPQEQVSIVFTSNHGTSPSFDAGATPTERFNARQFEVICNGFLNVRYGVGEWVLNYEDNSIWLNHNLIYERGLDLAAVQNEVAIFAMQFRGISHALSSTAMRSSYFGSGYARLMQNGFYPRRSGDVILNFMPGWIEEREGVRSLSGSMYGYDRAVPLIFYGVGCLSQRVERRVEMTSVASTLSHLAGISEPAASEGERLTEIGQ